MPSRGSGIRRPKLTSLGRRPPKGWSLTPDTVFSQLPADLVPRKQEPAGDPPVEWQGTRPEWAVYWALQKLGYKEGIDFAFQLSIPGVGSGPYSMLDFYVYELHLALEVQGTFWHLGQGTEKQALDIFRQAHVAQQGITLIFIDEPDALARPIEVTKAALNYDDQSRVGRGI